ncbi:MAG: class I SAM-dependent methyltransferase [Minisyncoccia bacterium]
MNIIQKSIFVLKNEGFNAFLIKVFKFPITKINSLREKLLHEKAKRNSKKVALNLKQFNSQDVEEVFDFSWNFYKGLIKPLQIKEEFLELLKIFKELNPKFIMEIETAQGGSLFYFCKLARDDATIISIDLPEEPFGGGYPEWKIPIYQAFKKENQKLYLIREDSHKQETLEKVKEILNGNQLDFLFIDGDHSYEGVKKDFEMYSPLVKKGGIIAFHDITPKGIPELTGGVPKFWQEIKDNFRKKELIKDLEQEGYGIGVIIR